MTGDFSPKIQPLLTWRSAICDSELQPTTRHVALTLSLWMNERAASAFPGATTLADATGLSERAVREHLNVLVRTGWLEVVERGGMRGERRKANHYRAATPAAGSRVDTDAPLQETAETPAANDADPCTTFTPSLQDLSKNSSSPADKPPRKRDPIFDALCEVTNTDPKQLTKSGRGEINRAVRELRALEADPNEIQHRHALLRRRYPNVVITVSALVKHWATLGIARSLAAVPDITPEEQAEFDALMRELS